MSTLKYPNNAATTLSYSSDSGSILFEANILNRGAVLNEAILTSRTADRTIICQL